MTTVIHLDSTTQVVAPVGETTVVTSGSSATATTEVVRTAVVVAGQLGPAGVSSLAGLLDVNLTAAEEGDLLTKQGTYWTNTRRANVTDGGNF